MKRYVDDQVRQDLGKKMVVLTGPRQVGKTTLSRQLIEAFPGGQYLNFDVPVHRAVIQQQGWRQAAPLIVLDEIHKMRDWKGWLKGVVDGRAAGQALLVTGSARMDTFRQAGESLAGRYFRMRLHPLSVREWCEGTQAMPAAALTHLLERGGFPEPALAAHPDDARRWRADYFAGLVREDVLEFSRLQEVNAMRLFAEMLRSRVGSPLSIASIARDLQVAPAALAPQHRPRHPAGPQGLLLRHGTGAGRRGSAVREPGGLPPAEARPLAAGHAGRRRRLALHPDQG
jgi:predicted AAA+ superfamily ATPase